MERYSKYKCADFASDQRFIDWVRNPDPRYDTSWAAFVESHPELAGEIADARLIVQSMYFKETELSKVEKQALWNTIAEDTRKNDHTVMRYWRIAAACAASVAILFGVWQWLGNAGKQHDTLAEFAAKTVVTAADNAVQVVLSDQTNYNITASNSELKYEEKGKLTVNSQEIVRQQVPGKKGKEVKFNQVIVPWGKRTAITFADGTRMWMNAGSRAVYPVEFVGEREVLIEGEAYFEVARDENRPFVVKIGTVEVKVLGTSFNVNAYPQQDEISVALVSGSVEVAGKNQPALQLYPDQVIRINCQTHGQTVADTDVYDFICWKDGFLQFKSETLESVLRKIERHYAITISVEASLEEYRISGKLDLKENIGGVLKVIEKLAPIRYELVNNKIFIFKK